MSVLDVDILCAQVQNVFNRIHMPNREENIG